VNAHNAAALPIIAARFLSFASFELPRFRILAERRSHTRY